MPFFDFLFQIIGATVASVGDAATDLVQEHGNTSIGNLRMRYGQDFAPGFSDNEKLSDILGSIDEKSLAELMYSIKPSQEWPRQ